MNHITAYFPTRRTGVDSEERFDVASEADVDQLIGVLAEDHTGDAYVYHETRMREGTGKHDHKLIVGIREGDRGALYFRDDEHGECYSRGPGPDHRVDYEQWEFPPYCELPIADIRAALVEFLDTARRPESVTWQTDDPDTTLVGEALP